MYYLTMLWTNNEDDLNEAKSSLDAIQEVFDDRGRSPSEASVVATLAPLNDELAQIVNVIHEIATRAEEEIVSLPD